MWRISSSAPSVRRRPPRAVAAEARRAQVADDGRELRQRQRRRVQLQRARATAGAASGSPRPCPPPRARRATDASFACWPATYSA